MKILVNNRKAYHNYEILDEYEAGLKLNGGELKSIMNSRASISEAFVDIRDGEAWLKQCHVDHYKMAQGFEREIEETRPRKMLLHKNEIEKLRKKTAEKGWAIVVLDLHYSDSRRVKAKIALARGKKLHDKRQAIKKRDMERGSRMERVE